MDEVDCDKNVACENDQECMKGYACFTGSNGTSYCDDIARYQCRKGCPDGEVLDPLRYCECISIEERRAMFCDDGESEAEPAAAEPSEESAEERMIQKITCPDGQTLNCYKDNKYCVDDSPVFCRGHQLPSEESEHDHPAGYGQSTGGAAAEEGEAEEEAAAPVLAGLGETCEGHDETANAPFPSCEEGLTCEIQDGVFIPGSESICVEPPST